MILKRDALSWLSRLIVAPCSVASVTPSCCSATSRHGMFGPSSAATGAVYIATSGETPSLITASA